MQDLTFNLTLPENRNKHMINLEDVIKQEELICTIQDQLVSGIDVNETCDEWFISSESSAVSSIEKLFKNNLIRRSLRVALIQEILSIVLFNFMGTELKLLTDIQNNMKNLIF
jgi:hypothetical protein